MIELKLRFNGEHISKVCKDAVKLADEKQEAVSFRFNDTPVVAHPGEKPEEVESRWDRDREALYQAYIASPEYKERVKNEAEELDRKMNAHMTETAKTEAEMRDTSDKWPYTMEQLTEYINSLVEREHDYGTCAYAMSLAATAAFNFVARKLGTTGFQSSCADLDFLRRSRGIKGPFMILRAQDALYPQYDLRKRLDEALTEWQPWLKEQAAANLVGEGQAHPAVTAHWKYLSVGGKP